MLGKHNGEALIVVDLVLFALELMADYVVANTVNSASRYIVLERWQLIEYEVLHRSQWYHWEGNRWFRFLNVLVKRPVAKVFL